MNNSSAVMESLEAGEPALRCIRVALAGCGTVGSELFRLVSERSRSIEQRYGVRFEFTRVLVRDTNRPRPVSIPSHLLTSDLDAFVQTDADIVVEAVGGLEPARRIAATALASGRTFVTANKALLAACGPELTALASRGRGRILYEACVAGGVPVIRVLRDALAETGVRAIRGILNGTTNYILTRMEEGAAFPVALDEARSLGYAEADPTRDLDGHDAADKVAVLAWLAFGIEPAALRIARRGILPDADRLVLHAHRAGGVLRLIGECIRTDDGVLAAVEPIVLPAASTLARTKGCDNAIEIDTQHNGTILLSGPGAGGPATASALLSDMITNALHMKPCGPDTRPMADTRPLSWLISVPAADRGSIALERSLRANAIYTAFADQHDGITIVITEPCSRARVACLERDLHAIGRVPVIARCELPTSDIAFPRLS